MSLVRRAAKRDQSEKAIVEYLRKAGWSVLKLSLEDAPDLLCGRHGATVLIECKSGNKKLRPGQAKWGREWKGDPPYVIRTVDEAAALTRAIGNLGR
jgi:hypothetical protein